MDATGTPTQYGTIPAPSGQVGHWQPFDAPDTLYTRNILTQCLCVGISGTLICLRVYVRVILKRAWILEDTMASLSFIFLTVYSMILTALIHKHGGTHQWNVSKADLEHVLFYANMCQITYGPAVTFIKTTILMLYLRVFTPSKTSKIRYTIYALMAIIIGFYIGLTVSKILQCIPREKIWQTELDGRCIDLSIVLKVSGAFNILSDIAILLVPIPVLWGLKRSRLRKIGIYSIFTVGSIGPVFGIVGFTQRLKLASSEDQSFNQPIISLWALAELATGMIVICLPVLPSIFGRRKKSSTSSEYISRHSRTTGLNLYGHRGTHDLSDEEQLANGTYLELGNSSRFDQKGKDQSKSPAYSNRVTAGSRPGSTSINATDNNDQDGSGRILKTVTVEQFKTAA